MAWVRFVKNSLQARNIFVGMTVPDPAPKVLLWIPRFSTFHRNQQFIFTKKEWIQSLCGRATTTLSYIHLFGSSGVFTYFISWITYLVTPSPGAEKVGRDTADCGRGGALPLDGVPIGVEVAIGSPLGTWLAVDCCGVIPDRRGLVTRPLASPMERGTSDSLSRKQLWKRLKTKNFIVCSEAPYKSSTTSVFSFNDKNWVH